MSCQAGRRRWRSERYEVLRGAYPCMPEVNPGSSILIVFLNIDKTANKEGYVKVARNLTSRRNRSTRIVVTGLVLAE